MSRQRIALILAGGAARGAYEVGVVQHILEDVSRDLGRPVRFDFYCGTSVGAINACALAAFAEAPSEQATRLRRHWERLRVGQVVRIDAGEVLHVMRSLIGRPARSDHRGGVLDPTGLERIVSHGIPWPKIGDNIRAGYLDAVTVSTTHIATGKTTVFVERRDSSVPYWGRDPTIRARAAQLGAAHALASAAIPFLFPAVAIDGEYHCDGGLRQNVPLSPARRLGADGLVVIAPRYASVDEEQANETAFPSPFFLLGKVLNALLLDRLDGDIDRLQRITSVLDAGVRVYGPDFLDKINRELNPGSPERALRPIRAVLVRASQNIAALAAEFVRAPAFQSRASGVVARLLRRLGEGSRESDLLSYLLFDGEFARQLMEVGRADARAKHEELVQFFDRLQPAASAARTATGP